MLKKPAVVATVTALACLPVQAGADASSRDKESPRRALEGRTIVVGSADDMRSGPRGTVRTARLNTAPYKMVAVTWRGRAAPDVDVRTRSGGSWSRWRELHPLGEDAPDRGTTEAGRSARVSATELLWVGRSDGAQLRLDGEVGRRTRLVLVDPGSRPSDVASTAQGVPALPRSVAPDPTKAPQPRIRGRRAWGADESWRNGTPVYNRTIKQAHLHHTAGTNAYGRADVPAILRGDYWYHTQVLGWSDLGYNFVVDKFGRIWEGRAGGIGRAVRGAHTLGFNHASVGVAAMGNFDRTRPPSDMVRALVRLSAWKLDAHDRQPAGYTWVTSQGSDRYPEGTRVRLPVTDGHRDTNETACPGDRLYGKLPDIRRRAQQRADAVYPTAGSAVR